MLLQKSEMDPRWQHRFLAEDAGDQTVTTASLFKKLTKCAVHCGVRHSQQVRLGTNKS